MDRKRFRLLQQFAKSLGWPELQQCQHVVEDAPRLEGQLIAWYETGSFDDVLFQINETPSLCAAVYAVRYRLCTGWHRFRLGDDINSLREEARRLDEWLNRRWFESVEGRRRFRQRHPECGGYTRAKLLRDGPPYEA